MIPVSQLSDAALSELFAAKVAGWVPAPYRGWVEASGEVVWDHAQDECAEPVFATSADAVLPWLEKKEIYEVIYNNNPYTGSKGVSIQVSDAFTEDLKEPRARSQWVNAPTFPRAACIALLAAKGITEVES